jgi:hypothetical protein
LKYTGCPESAGQEETLVKVRLQKGDPVLEVTVHTGEISVIDGQGKELVVVFSSEELQEASGEEERYFYTDLNGL